MTETRRKFVRDAKKHYKKSRFQRSFQFYSYRNLGKYTWSKHKKKFFKTNKKNAN